MISGLILNNTPFITITIGWTGGVQIIPVVLDTGFTGELKLPTKIVTDLGLSVTHTEPITLGNGQTVNMNASIALVSLEGTIKLVNVLIDEGSSLIGINLMRRFRYEQLNLDLCCKYFDSSKSSITVSWNKYINV